MTKSCGPLSCLAPRSCRPSIAPVVAVQGISVPAQVASFETEYFGAPPATIKKMDEPEFAFPGRNRRPPRDPVRIECQAALEGVGSDPQIGFLQAVRPGRPSLALDLMEELRSPIADRLALTLINWRQLTSKDFIYRPGGGITLTDEGRRGLLTAYQQRKAAEVHHQVAGRSTAIGLIPHLQARPLARHLREDMEPYSLYVGR